MSNLPLTKLTMRQSVFSPVKKLFQDPHNMCSEFSGKFGTLTRCFYAGRIYKTWHKASYLISYLYDHAVAIDRLNDEMIRLLVWHRGVARNSLSTGF